MDDLSVISSEELTIRDISLIARDYRDNELWDFFMCQDHRVITKWLNYFKVYEQWFRRYRGTDLTFLEIGIWKGGSLEMWKRYFGGKARIIGVDIDEDCRKFADDQVAVEIGDQEDPAFWARFKQKYPRVDVLLDDGGHEMAQQIATFKAMFDHVKDGGLYVCEDLHTSYMDKYKGGVRREGTFIEFAKTLIDDMHLFHVDANPTPNYNSVNLEALHFYNSMLVIEKHRRRYAPISLMSGTEE